MGITGELEKVREAAAVPADPLDQREHRGIAAIVDIHFYVLAGFERGPARAEHRNVAPAEAVDGLLRVAHRGEVTRARP